MADITLSDGREITFDLFKITFGEWKGLFDPEESDQESDTKIARCAGLTYEELLALPLPDSKRLSAAFFKRAREPLADPNSLSASTSP